MKYDTPTWESNPGLLRTKTRPRCLMKKKAIFSHTSSHIIVIYDPQQLWLKNLTPQNGLQNPLFNCSKLVLRFGNIPRRIKPKSKSVNKSIIKTKCIIFGAKYTKEYKFVSRVTGGGNVMSWENGRTNPIYKPRRSFLYCFFISILYFSKNINWTRVAPIFYTDTQYYTSTHRYCRNILHQN